MLDIDFPELGVVRLARPCSQKWSQMKGSERVRQCAACKSKVYNFAEISSEEARLLLRANSEACRIFTRFDGTVLTKDCPKGFSHGWRHARNLLPSARGAAIMLLVLMALGFAAVTTFGDNIRRLFAMSSNCHPMMPPRIPVGDAEPY